MQQEYDTPTTHSIVVGYLLWILGFLGAHRFYYGKPVTGTLWFFTLGLLGIGCGIAESRSEHLGRTRKLGILRPGVCLYLRRRYPAVRHDLGILCQNKPPLFGAFGPGGRHTVCRLSLSVL